VPLGFVEGLNSPKEVTAGVVQETLIIRDGAYSTAERVAIA